MLRPRITPCLLIQDGGLVKTVKFRDPRYLGDPINAVKIFNEKEADELIVLDLDATVNGVEPDYKLIGRLAAECRMPLCYGGGVRTAEQASRIVGLGVEKVAFSTAAVEAPALISEVSAEIGRQSVVVVLDFRKRTFGRGYEVFTRNGTRNTKRDVMEAAVESARLGAGEIVFNSIDRDGAMAGYDLDLARTARNTLNIPFTILGGAGAPSHIEDLLAACGIVGAAAGSLFVYKGGLRAVLINYPDQAAKDAMIAVTRTVV
ncbi:AglZ/HisF2 family acetamidino modification protein [Brevundimonas sp. Root1423]|uniref:AglZ/HisF2 family acetamidino modification protein n=1 Tax=Brevundimonas sp. Root1423 TaxID=1736462 RepID=UPI0006FF2526|nr:AglZ/HisF2 family acetamidino modification protein [Brevundimonas sp. Root1423]KQY84847.1 glycosyl amidation-associated protein WbuZ [Brevundimonas sp. Root1423]